MTTEIILQAIVGGLLVGLIYALIAAGLSLIFGLMEIVNFAHGEHLMLSMFSSFWLWSLFGLDPVLSLPFTVLLMALCGVLTHYLLIRYILKAKMLIQICATFGLSIFLRSLAQFFWTPDFRIVEEPLLEGRLEVGGLFIGQPQLAAGVVCLGAFLLLYLFVTRTETGLALQATAQDREAAEILGIPSDRMFALGWAIGLGCVGVAGAMMSNYFFIFTDVGVNFALFAFVAVALGGFGSIIGCLYAGVIIGLVESLGGLLIDPSFKLLYVFAIYLLVVTLRPRGLFGRY
ncbi:MAG: branched-chain amino acid ABC transporter permease [Gammaproteobacteria bacterium]|nr:branched-chain amino acid ABC transporter permease [Gammaproteobacteria bacterium]MBT8436421.1 branched-chain amino acid ABC transporter permease [Gammaproteobacteria bacterium]